ncbi:MAG TPA: hypothetical protein VK601_19680, partial [Kofleriaceae bacterium]|nr:hypothetical protein [Kofleriaceae bacterium]
DISAEHVQAAVAALPRTARIRVGDFFQIDWDRELAAVPEPILVVGNPPWVTSAALGALGARNLPRKHNLKQLRGLDAVTGKSNFDVSEWMLLRLLTALQGRNATIAVLCKTSVARRVIEFAASQALAISPIGLWRIDTQAQFGAAVDAVLLACRTARSAGARGVWPVFAALDDATPRSRLGVIDGALASDVRGFRDTQHLSGRCQPEWRSGLKHDCAAVMELSARDGGLVNGRGDAVAVEDAVVYPLLKSSDLANRRLEPRRRVIVPQTALGQDTAALRVTAPQAWRYLTRHRHLLDARKSSIYRGQPPFAVFGVGEYSFAPWKVAISGLYKRLEFCLVGPSAGRPTLLDDTCYFLPFDRATDARTALRALQSEPAQAYLQARIFWDAKRPISKTLLQGLDLAKLASSAAKPAGEPRQQRRRQALAI